MKTYIILIPVEQNNEARKQCEDIENLILQMPNPNSINVRNKILEQLDDNIIDMEVEALSDFMDRVNDEAFNVDDYFISYVHSISFSN